MVHQAESEAEKNTSDMRQFLEQYTAVLVTSIEHDPKNISSARQVGLKGMCEIPVKVSTQAICLIEAIPHPKVADSHPSMTAKGIMDA